MAETKPNTLKLSRTVPVVAETDVLIAGGGIAGCMAAVAAARNGARVILVDRFGRLGGNMGPGMFSGGVVHLALPVPDAMHEGLRGIPGEFLSRCAAYVGGQLGHDYFLDTEVVSYVWSRLMEENNVRLMLNTWVSQPMMKRTRVVGLVVDDKSGARAVRARVVIDATGDADVAALAGAPTDECRGYFRPGMYFAIGDVDVAAFEHFRNTAPEPSAEDTAWRDRILDEYGGGWYGRSTAAILPKFRVGWMHGEYRVVRQIGNIARVTFDHGLYTPKHNIVGAQVGIQCGPTTRSQGVRIDSSAPDVLTLLETVSRQYIFETAQFLRHHVPGFERSYLHVTAPYFHHRAGRSAVCDYVLTRDDVRAGARFDDVLFRLWGSEVKEGEFTVEGYDFPYRQLLPKGVEGLLMAGRAAIVQPPTNRTRNKLMLMGQAAGLAAALAARDKRTPREVDVKELQRLLYRKYHVVMGEPERVAALGLAGEPQN
jgi:hypothetical protein